jgi:hypothetical protein
MAHNSRVRTPFLRREKCWRSQNSHATITITMNVQTGIIRADIMSTSGRREREARSPVIMRALGSKIRSTRNTPTKLGHPRHAERPLRFVVCTNV